MRQQEEKASVMASAKVERARQRGPSNVSFQPQAGQALGLPGQQTPPPPPPRLSKQQAADLTVCDITGDWGRYQWSVCLFATLYSALTSFAVVFGPILTPDLKFKCNQAGWNDELDGDGQQQNSSATSAASQQLECFKNGQECANFLYPNNHDDGQLTLTNGFDLVCERQWLRSLVSSAALAGMLISSVTLGLFSDKFGRLRCIQLGYALSLLANTFAIITRNYFLFCACVLVMTYAQVAAANALCTLLMEITSPRFRFVPMFEYGAGWGLGVMLLPLLNQLTRDYRLLMGTLLALQLLLLPWLHLGVFESIRWLLSEGHFNRAQIELRRVCRINRARQEGAQLAQDIASIQAQQLRKASRVIETERAPLHLARALGTQVDETARELDMLSAAIRKSFFGIDDDDDQNSGRPEEVTSVDAPQAGAVAATTTNGGMAQIPAVLSPTLSRMSFCVSTSQLDSQAGSQPVVMIPRQQQQQELVDGGGGQQQLAPPGKVALKSRNQLEAIVEGNRRDSFTTQGLIQLALKYSKTVQQGDSGRFFLVQMFHRNLWRCTLILALLSIMFETSYYGLLQANKFVGSSVALNYVLGGLCDCAAASVSMLMLALFSRKFSLISTTLVGSLVCLSMALTYHLIPEQQQQLGQVQTPTRLNADVLPQIIASNNSTSNELDGLINNEDHLEPINSSTLLRQLEQTNLNQLESGDELMARSLIELRDTINFYLMNVGKFVIVVGMQVAATIAMEAYPNNLRQSGPGVIIFVGRLGSIVAPFLFNDASEEKRVFKLTLVSLGLVGLLVCCLVPACIRDNKDRELCDQLDEIDDDEEAQKQDRDDRRPSTLSRR